MEQEIDGLYLSGKWVCSPDSFRATYQANDLTKPDTLQCSYVSTFQLPDTITVRELTRNAEQLDAGAGATGAQLLALAIEGNERTFVGFAELESFSDGWNITLYEDKTGFFERLERSIRTADLSRYNHSWTVEGINKLAEETAGVCYSAIDYGLLDSGEVPLDCVFPSVYVHSVVSQILSEEKYTLVGDLPNDPLYKALTIPFTEGQPTAKDTTFQEDRIARVTLEMPNNSFDVNRNRIDRYQPYNIDDRPLDGWQQGKLKNFNTATHTYVCDTEMRVLVEAFQAFKLRVRGGAFEIILTLEKNGIEVSRTYQQYETGHNPFNLNTENVSINKLVQCKKGDTLRVRFVAQRRTQIGGFDCVILNNPDSSWLAVTPDLNITTGDVWQVSRNLPDLTALELIKTIAFLCGASYSVDPIKKRLELKRLTDTTNNTSGAVDWSAKINEAEAVLWVPKMEPYGQKNRLKWKETAGTDKGYADGVISQNAANLPKETTLFELPFSASPLSAQTMPGYGFPVHIPLRTVTRAGGQVTINNQNTTPRLLLNYAPARISINTRVFDSEGNATVKAINLQSCWFAVRPSMAIKPETNFSLAFDAVSGNRGEQSLIKRNYGGLLRVLRRIRVVNLSMYLTPFDIATLNLYRPVRLKNVRIGSLYINDNYFYVNKIGPYQYGRPVTVTLIAFD